MKTKRTVSKNLPSKTPQHEFQRLQKLLIFEHAAQAEGFTSIAGVDEAGRGPLAGPVVAAACVIEKGVLFEGINDSKLLTPQKRQELYLALSNHPSVTFGIGVIEADLIDQINILQATIQAMHQALEDLSLTPDYLLVDAIALDYRNLPCKKIIKGDTLSQSIAAASVIAKERRDQLMQELHEEYPQYGFAENKGYGTAKHREALSKYGPCPIHRRSFEPIKSFYQLS